VAGATRRNAIINTIKTSGSALRIGGLALILAVALVVYLIVAGSRYDPAASGEGFATPALRPCVVYLTKNYETCDNPNKYYDKLSTELDILRRNALLRGDNTEVRHIDAVKADRTAGVVPLLGDCKIAFNDLKEVNTAETPYKMAVRKTGSDVIPDYLRVQTDRGAPEHWAFCYKKENGFGALPANVTVDTSEAFEFDGEKYNRAAFKDLDFSTIRAEYCAQQARSGPVVTQTGSALPLMLGFTIADAATMRVSDIKAYNRDPYGTIQEDARLTELVKKLYIRRLSPTGRVGYYNMYMTPQTINGRIFQFTRDFCDKTTLMSEVKYTFNLASISAALADVLLEANVAYTGDMEALRARARKMDEMLLTLLQRVIGKNLDPRMREYISFDSRIYMDVGYTGVSDPYGINATIPLTRQVLREDPLNVMTNPRSQDPPLIDYNAETSYSLAFWLRVEKPGPGWRNVLFLGKADNWAGAPNQNRGVDRTPGIWIYPNNDKWIHFVHRRTGTPASGNYNNAVNVPFTSIANGSWFHYTAVVEPYRILIYINGTKVSETTYPNGEPVEWNAIATKKLYFGQSPEGGYRDTGNGAVEVKKVYWYNYSLSTQEIKDLSYVPPPPPPPPLPYITGRYLRLERVSWPPGGQAQGYLNILELSAIGRNGSVLSANASLWPQYGGAGTFGAHFLTDKNTRADWWVGGTGLPHTTNADGSYMELDFGKPVDMTTLVIENRRDCCTSRIIGTQLRVLDANRKIIWYSTITGDQPTYRYTNLAAMNPPTPTQLCAGNVCVTQPQLNRLKSLIDSSIPITPIRTTSIGFEERNNSWAIQPESGVAFVIRDRVSGGDKRHALWKNRYRDI